MENNESLVDKMKTLQLRNNLLMEIMNLTRYSGYWDGEYEDQEGEYVRLEDVLKIFGGENEEV